MATIQHSWTCDICKQAYLSVERAESCERKHTPISSVHLVKLWHDNAVEGFPAHIEVTVDGMMNEDLAGTYELTNVKNEKTNEHVYEKDKYRY
jgi:hypothetical protein